MREYSPKRRTALVLTGTGAAGAYHAGALRALEESGVKLDLVVGSGVGCVAASLAAVDGGSKLHAAGGFWDGARSTSFFRARSGLRLGLALLSLAALAFLLPLVLALLAGLLFPLLLLADVASPGVLASALARGGAALPSVRLAYLLGLAAPVFLACALAAIALLRALARDRRRLAEAFETPYDAGPGIARLRESLWAVARGVALSGAPPAPAEIGRRYVALAQENEGQPGFRELILRAGDLETGRALPFVLLAASRREAFAAARSRGPRSRLDGLPEAVDLASPAHAALFFDAVASGLLPVPFVPPRRAAFPKGGIFAGEVHRLADATLVGGSGLEEALQAGAEQVILVSASAERPSLPPRRRGPRALFDACLLALERQAVERDVAEMSRVNRLIETLGHESEGGERAWQDPETGKLHRPVALYVVRPEARALLPLELDGALDPASEVEQTLADLAEQGYRDAFRAFVEPVLGASPEPKRAAAEEIVAQGVEL